MARRALGEIKTQAVDDLLGNFMRRALDRGVCAARVRIFAEQMVRLAELCTLLLSNSLPAASVSVKVAVVVREDKVEVALASRPKYSSPVLIDIVR